MCLFEKEIGSVKSINQKQCIVDAEGLRRYAIVGSGSGVINLHQASEIRGLMLLTHRGQPSIPRCLVMKI